MKKNDILNILHDKIQTVVISAVNDQLSAVSTIIDLIIENEKIYFILAKGDELFSALEKNQLLYLNGYNQVGTFKQVITMSVKIREIDQDQTNELIGNNDTILQLYKNSKALNILHGYEIYEYDGEYTDFSQDPVQRDFFSSQQLFTAKAFQVTGQCIYCKACYRVCPQKCIDITKKPAEINIYHCLQCGKCADICPRHAITKTKVQLSAI